MSNNSKKRVVEEVAADLAEETRELTALLAAAAEPDWDRATPAQGWSVRDQVTHLAFFDEATLLALRAPEAFAAQRAELAELGERFADVVAERYRRLSGGECLAWLSRSRDELLAEYQVTDPSARLPWYGVEQGVPSSVTGRLMETWAHGQDIRDALGVLTTATPRLGHVADLGVRTFAFSFQQRGLPAPAEPVHVALAGPGGSGGPGEQLWTRGPADAADRVEGDLLDFCLVVTQRRNVADTALRVTGNVAARWMSIAQVFAGGPTDPRPAGLFTARPVAAGERVPAAQVASDAQIGADMASGPDEGSRP